MSEYTTVNVSDETWKRLILRKDRGDTFDDVITEALDELEECQKRVSELESELEDLREE